MPRGLKVGGRDFQKGNQASKGHGRPRVPDHVREARKLDSAKFLELINKYVHSTRAELTEKVKDPETPAMELIVIKVIVEAINSGSLAYFSTITDRLVGKVPDRHQFSGSLHGALVQAMQELDDENESEPRDV